MKKTLFLSAILATALCSSAFAGLTTDTSVVNDITYNGGVFTLSSTGDISRSTHTADVNSTNGTITAGETSYDYINVATDKGWQIFASNQGKPYGHTIHLTQAGTYTSNFSPFSFGGLIVDSTITGSVTLGRNASGVEIVGTNAVNMSIGANTTILGGPDNKITNEGIHVMQGGTWDIAANKTLTLNASGKEITFHENVHVALSGAGTLSLSSNMNLGSGSSIAFSTNKIGGTGKFDGSGTVELQAASGNHNNKFADTWTGTVLLTGDPGNGTNIDALGTANSLVEFKGASGGYSNQWSNGTVYHNVRFTDVDGTAWAWGAFASGGTQAITFAGKIDGDGHIVTNFDAEGRAEGFTFSGDVSEWTGGIKQTSAGRHTVTFKGNATTVKAELIKHSGGNIYLVVDNTKDTTFSAAQTVTDVTVQGGGKATFGAVTASEMKVKDDSTLVLTDTSYNAEIKGYSGYIGTVEVKGQTADTTIKSIYQDANNNTDGVIKLVLDNGHTTSITNWATVQSVTLKNNSSVTFNYHKVGTLTVESGSSNVFSGAGIGTDETHHVLNNVEVKDSASLTFGAANTKVSTITLGDDSSITVGDGNNHNFSLTTTELTVNGDANINANLVMNSGTLTFADNAVLTMGCDVTIGNTVTVVLTDAMVESIMNGNDVEIIAGVDKAYLSQSLTFIGSGELSSYVDEHEAVYSLKQVGDRIYITPEPATATLSLLALAGLCARRRRH